MATGNGSENYYPWSVFGWWVSDAFLLWLWLSRWWRSSYGGAGVSPSRLYRQPSQSAGGARRRKSLLRAIAGVLLLGSLAKGAVMCFFFALAVFSCLVYASLVGHGSSSKELGNQRLWLSHHDASPRDRFVEPFARPAQPSYAVAASASPPLIYFFICFA